MADPFVLILYNMHLRIRTQEKENAELKKKSYRLHTEVLREERAVQRAEDWVRENEENLPKLESILLAEEEKLDQCTGKLLTTIDETEELRLKGDEVFDQAQRLQATLKSLRWKVEHPEEVEKEEAQELIQEYEGHYGSLEPEEVQEEMVEGKTKEKKEKKRSKEKKAKKKSSCFSCLWSWAWR